MSRVVVNAGKQAPGPSAGRHDTSAKRGKACSGCQAQENLQPVQSAGKQSLRKEVTLD